MATARGALKALDFGEVDAESEADLERRFVRTADFNRFLDPGNPKGRGNGSVVPTGPASSCSTRRLPQITERNGELAMAQLGMVGLGRMGAGHLVKMVHNGIEYGVMAA